MPIARTAQRLLHVTANHDRRLPRFVAVRKLIRRPGTTAGLERVDGAYPMGYSSHSVEARPRKLVEYVNADGRSPFGEWLAALKDVHARAAIRKRLNRVRLGNLGDWRTVGEGVMELRVDVGPGYRAYCGEDGPVMVVLLCGGDKSSQRTDIARAKELWADYRS